MENKKPRVLVVDDEPANLELIRQILSEKYSISFAVNGDTALSILKKIQPDIVLLDVLMQPGMDGYEVCRRIKADEKCRDIPVLFISSLGDTMDKIKAFSTGGVDYITKPFQPEEMKARIESQITIRRQKMLLLEEIEQRRRTEEALHRERALLAGILDSSLDGVAALAAIRNKEGGIIDFRILKANARAAEMTGRSNTDKIEKTLATIMPGMKEDGIIEKFAEVCNSGTVLNFEHYYDHEGLDGWYRIVGIKLGDGLVVTISDITEKKKISLALEQQAHVDGLTGIANRRYFDSYLEREWTRMKREKAPLTLIMADVDFFKNYNDCYGHQMGDVCLKKVAAAMKKSALRPADMAARYGGEEFALILPMTPSMGAVKVAGRTMDSIRKMEIKHEKSEVHPYITVSMGIATVIPTSDFQLKDFIGMADKALYSAKKEGRNRYVVWV